MRGGVPCLVFRHPSSSNQVMPIKLHRICSFSRAELYSALYCSSTRDIGYHVACTCSATRSTSINTKPMRPARHLTGGGGAGGARPTNSS